MKLVSFYWCQLCFEQDGYFLISQISKLARHCCLVVSVWSTSGWSQVLSLSEKELWRASLLAGFSFHMVISSIFHGTIFSLPFLPQKSYCRPYKTNFWILLLLPYPLVFVTSCQLNNSLKLYAFWSNNYYKYLVGPNKGTPHGVFSPEQGYQTCGLRAGSACDSCPAGPSQRQRGASQGRPSPSPPLPIQSAMITRPRRPQLQEGKSSKRGN